MMGLKVNKEVFPFLPEAVGDIIPQMFNTSVVDTSDTEGIEMYLVRCPR
jgi:hypothetical protein